MGCLFQFGNATHRRKAPGHGVRAVLLPLVLWMAFPVFALAQGPPASAIGRVEGNDISVEDGTPVGRTTATVAPSIFIRNGSVVTVHSGDARLTLLTGGEVDICGPAKMTLLQSNGALTLALDFGQVRVRIPASIDLRIFTPTIVGTPIGIDGAARDISLGLELDNSLCVLATSGAMQLEHQFTSEKMIIPQTGEFFLASGKLLPVVGKPGGCRCQAVQAEPQLRPIPRSPGVSPDIDLAGPAQIAQSLPPSITTRPEANLEFSISAQPNEERPAPSAPKNTADTAPPADVPIYSVVAPPLRFSAGSPAAPPDLPVNTFLLIREAHVDPEWQFSGHVDAPDFAQAMQHALGEKTSGAQKARTRDRAAGAGTGKTHSIWGFLRKIF